MPLVPQEPPLTLELSTRPSSTFTPLLVAASCVVPASAMAGKRPHQADVTPKVAKRAKAASASGLQRQAPAEPCRGGDPFAGCLNAKIQHALCCYDDKVIQHPAFDGIMHDEPTDKSGIAAYDPEEAMKKLNSGQTYVASCPFFWLNLRFEAQPNVPKYWNRIDNLRKHFWHTPATYPDTITVAHTRGDELPHLRKGQLAAACMPEVRDALRVAVGMAVDDSSDEDIFTLLEWRVVLRSIPIRFMVTDPGHSLLATFKILVQGREDLAVKNENMRMSSLLRSYEIMDLKKQLEDGGNKQNKKSLAAYYSKIGMASASEGVSPTFVENAMALHNQVLTVNEVSDICFRFDQLGNENPMDSVAKYKEVGTQCDKKSALMIWSYEMLWDHWHCTDGKESIPLRLLEGKVPGWGNKSIIDLFIFKRAMRDSLWRRLEQFNWETDVKTHFKTWTESVVACRAKFGVIHPLKRHIDGVCTDRSLPHSWPASAGQLLLVMESLVYGYEYDSAMVKTMAGKRTCEDFLETSDASHMMSELMNRYEDEKKAAGLIDEIEVDPTNAEEEQAAENFKMAVIANQSQVEILISDVDSGVATMENADVVKAKSHTQLAERRLRSNVKLVVASSQEELTNAIKTSEAGQAMGKGKSYVAIVLDAKTLCESGTQGKYRLPPTRPLQLAKLLGAVIGARATGDKSQSLPANDIIVAPDGSKGQDWEDKIVKALSPMKLDVSKRYAMYSQESLEKRMDRATVGTLEQMETILVLSPGPPNFKVGPRKLNPKASTRGNVIGPLETPDWHDTDSTWTVPWSDKKEMYSAENLPLPGGGCSVEHKKQKATKASDLVPAFWHEGPPVLATELAHLLQAASIIDLTPGSGHWAMFAVRKQIPYLGACFTEAHCNLLYSKLRSRILSSAMDANDTDLYDPNLSSLITSCRKDTTPNKADSKGSPGPTPPKEASATLGSSSGGDHPKGAAERQSLLDRIKDIKKLSAASSQGDGMDIDE